jgi:gamma-glutamyltranspeptidase/glutathione hydrolase
VLLEGQTPPEWREGLANRGHDVRVSAPYDSGFGHAHTVVVEPDGMLCGAADPRSRIGSVAGL